MWAFYVTTRFVKTLGIFYDVEKNSPRKPIIVVWKRKVNVFFFTNGKLYALKMLPLQSPGLDLRL